MADTKNGSVNKKDVQAVEAQGGGRQTVQQELAKLSEMIAWFQSDEFMLDEAVDAYTKAESLAAKIEKDLSALKNEITVIRNKFDE